MRKVIVHRLLQAAYLTVEGSVSCDPWQRDWVSMANISAGPRPSLPSGRLSFSSFVLFVLCCRWSGYILSSWSSKFSTGFISTVTCAHSGHRTLVIRWTIPFALAQKGHGVQGNWHGEHAPVVTRGCGLWVHLQGACIPKHSTWFERASSPVIPSCSVSNFLEAKPLMLA